MEMFMYFLPPPAIVIGCVGDVAGDLIIAALVVAVPEIGPAGDVTTDSSVVGNPPFGTAGVPVGLARGVFPFAGGEATTEESFVGNNAGTLALGVSAFCGN